MQLLTQLNELEKIAMIKKTNVLCKSIIVRFSFFRDKAMFHRSRDKLKNNFKLKLDLTKNR